MYYAMHNTRHTIIFAYSKQLKQKKMKQLINNNLVLLSNLKNGIQATFLVFTVASFLFLSYMDMSRTSTISSVNPENTQINKIPPTSGIETMNTYR